MGEVLDIRKNQPHIEGKACCLQCLHQWQAVCEIGVIDLECPACGLMKGVWCGLAVPEYMWQCLCGCVHFYINQNGASCCNCGVTQVME